MTSALQQSQSDVQALVLAITALKIGGFSFPAQGQQEISAPEEEVEFRGSSHQQHHTVGHSNPEAHVETTAITVFTDSGTQVIDNIAFNERPYYGGPVESHTSPPYKVENAHARGSDAPVARDMSSEDKGNVIAEWWKSSPRFVQAGSLATTAFLNTVLWGANSFQQSINYISSHSAQPPKPQPGYADSGSHQTAHAAKREASSQYFDDARSWDLPTDAADGYALSPQSPSVVAERESFAFGGNEVHTLMSA